jgi:uncharacterized membrane protein HdeD (DUF308 family)
MATTHTPYDHRSSPAGHPLLNALAESWWLILLRGIAAIAFGVLAILWPAVTLLTLTLIWAAYAVADGVLALWAATFGKGGEVGRRWWLALAGVASFAAGAFTFAWPATAAAALLLLIGCWSIVVGVLQIVGAIQLRKEIDGEWLLALSGIISILFGAVLLIYPGAGALAMIWTIGWFAILVGCSQIAVGLRLKQYKRPA